MVFGACQAELQRTILFFAEIARRSFVRTGGREHSNLKSINRKNVDKDVRRGFVFALAYFFFGLLYYNIISEHYKNLFPGPRAKLSLRSKMYVKKNLRFGFCSNNLGHCCKDFHPHLFDCNLLFCKIAGALGCTLILVLSSQLSSFQFYNSF